ncbi:hypothetical protein SAMN02745170_03213 [Propionispora hippei DSM 15287]|uniref:Uncharacterized protein n=2 Tax=Propionispora TaxID=112902 RepID=A0A1M6LRS3_9FIRM|nr:hypothetical protein SAMN02745170_03213 [Propionispora hippei DSM 15287]
MVVLMKQDKYILAENDNLFLVKRVIQYETGFEPGLELVGVRYEFWNAQYKDKYERDIIEEPVAGKIVRYCQLYAQCTDEEMLELFSKKSAAIKRE